MMTSLSIESHVIAIDYRGFADSSNIIPTESGLRLDARSAYDWILSQGVLARNIIVVGHSLGSGVATDLVYSISVENREKNTPLCGGLILFSGYASIADAAIGYPNVPILRPFLGNKRLEPWVKQFIHDKWSSHLKMSSIPVPILLLHGQQDYEIKPWHAKALFLEGVSGRLGSRLCSGEGYWEVRDGSSNLESFDSCNKTVLDGQEGELWSFDDKSNPIWLLFVKHAGHNDLSVHQVVGDTIESWLSFHSK
jgi:abhydrolase domain-containing protein 12